MSLTPEQLMIPRVMCIGTEVGTPNYPDATFLSGEVLILWNKHYYKHDGETKLWTGAYVSQFVVERFPNLFRPMPWYEGRKPEEMPEYIKYGHGSVYKVVEWKENKDYGVYALCERGEDYPLVMQPKTYPATEAEYIAYENSKK